MMYKYIEQKHKIFTEDGMTDYITVRDEAKKLLASAGAFKMFAPLKKVSGDSWQMMAYIDRMVEVGEIREITPDTVAGQNRVFVSN